jgi:hypothetical protein
MFDYAKGDQITCYEFKNAHKVLVGGTEVKKNKRNTNR